MWKSVKRMLGGSEPIETKSNSWVLREGESVQRDEVADAWASRDLPTMMAAIDFKTNAIDRHFLLMTIVHESYKRRKEKQMANICAKIAEMHIAEFPRMVGALKKDLGGTLPRVTTFQHYATLLTEQEEYERAIKVCTVAIEFGLDDGTKSGFEGRIKRIEKRQNF